VPDSLAEPDSNIKAEEQRPDSDRQCRLAKSDPKGEDDESCSEAHAPPRWQDPKKTLIVFDWDDTLCPTTACRGLRILEDNGPIIDDELRAALSAHEQALSDLLQNAAKLGGVAIVTMAQKHWVDKAIEQLMPSIATLLKNLGIEITSARTGDKKLLRASVSDCRESSQYLKKVAMKRVLKNFYKNGNMFTRALGLRKTRSWHNIISIGDSDAERLALQDLVFQHLQYDKSGDVIECRCKTLLSREELSPLKLMEQHRTIRDLLPFLVRYDNDLDLVLDNSGIACDNTLGKPWNFH
jgi:hypothetical protein